MTHSHIFTIQENDIKLLEKLAYFKDDNKMVILTHNGNWVDVACWNNKYQNIALYSGTIDRFSDKTPLR